MDVQSALKKTETLRLRLQKMVKSLADNRLFYQRHHNNSITIKKIEMASKPLLEGSLCPNGHTF